jgi:hypothetical protein
MAARWLPAVLLGAMAFCVPASAQYPRSQAEAERLEAQIVVSPGDPGIRARLIRYYSRVAEPPTDRVRMLRGQYIVWMIEHDPANEVLAEVAGLIDKDGHPLADSYAYGVADRAWRAVLARPDPGARILANAIYFFSSPDPDFARELSAAALKRFPADLRLGQLAGWLDALAVLGGIALDGYGFTISFDERLVATPAALAARREIGATTNTGLLSTVASFIAMQLPALRARLRPLQVRASLDLAARCYERAIAVEPDNPAWKTGLRSIYRTTASLAEKPADRHLYLERAARVPVGDLENLRLLPDLAQARFTAGDLPAADEAARDALRIAEANPGRDSGAAIHIGNIVLGRIALKKNDLEEARRRLLAAGRVTASPQLAIAGPDWSLAQDLLAKGERETVLQFLELCRGFWLRNNGRLDSFSATIKSGGGRASWTRPPLAGPVSALRLLKLLRIHDIKYLEREIINAKSSRFRRQSAEWFPEPPTGRRSRCRSAPLRSRSDLRGPARLPDALLRRGSGNRRRTSGAG